MKSRFIPSFITFLLILYYLLTILFPRDRYADEQATGRIYPQLCMILVVITSIWTIVRYKHNNNTLKTFTFFIVMFWGYFFTTCVSPMETISYILKSTSGYVFAILFYKFFKEDEAYTLRISTIIMYAIVVYGLFTYVQTREETVYGTFESPVGFIYSQLIPLVLLLNKNRWSPYIFLISFVMCLLSGQRTATIIALLYCFPAFKLFRSQVKIKDIVPLIVIVVFLALPYIETAVQNLILRNEHDVSKGYIGSGRDLFYAIVFDDYRNSDLFYQLFGHGIYSPVLLIKQTLGQAIFAHNGYLDTIYQFGILGLFIFIFCIFRVMRLAWTNIKIQKEYSYLLLFMGMTWLAKSSVSHGYLDLNSIPFSVALAYLIYKLSNYKYSSE